MNSPEQTNIPYWLCCGSTDRNHHHPSCTEHLEGHPERRKFGTAEEHRLPPNVTEVFNTGTEAFYKVKYDFGPLIEKWKKECTHPRAQKEEHLTGDGAMEYVEWYDNYCPDCGEKWTTND